ncbi:MAG TPA: alpha/beta hydrolase [Chloroflexota bacterium]|nr:alpha/beta hydrolase [Chloroflexota bacterium]
MLPPISRVARVALLLLLAGSLTIPRAWAQTAPAPRFDAASCPFKMGAGLQEGKDVRCGYLVVPEDHANPSGPTIKLAVAIFKSRHPAADGTPVFFLNGGPGGATVSELGPVISASNIDVVVGDHDLVLLDQRGTGLSRPSLSCKELDTLTARTMNRKLTLAQAEALDLKTVAQCRARLAASGVNLSAYTTLQDANDVADLRVALGYASVNLYGISYGTRLALSVMRSFPQGIRSVVLDSVYGPSVNVMTDPIRSAARDFNLLFASCAASRSCNRSSPNLKSAFYALVQRLDRQPAGVKLHLSWQTRPSPALISGATLVDVLFNALYVSSLIPRLPQIITHAAHGKYGLLANLISQVVAPPGSESYGMFLSVECSEDAPFATEAGIVAAGQSLAKPIRKDFVAVWKQVFHECGVWNVAPVSAAQKQPVVSSIPTMVLEDQFDPITPPSYGQAVAKTLSNGYFFTYPGLGHGARFSDLCPYTMVADFYDDPSARPDDSCIAQMQKPFA